MARVISVQNETYEKLNDTTAKLMQVTKERESYNNTIEFLLTGFSVYLEKLFKQAEDSPTFREKLSEAINKGDSEDMFKLIDDLGDGEKAGRLHIVR